MKKLITMLVLAMVVLVAGNAQAFTIQLGPGALGLGTDDGITAAFNQLGVYAQTTSTNNGDGTFSDVGNVAVTALIPPPVYDDEGLLSYAWSIYGGWDDVGGTVTPGTNAAGHSALFFNYTTGTMDLYASAGVPYDFNTAALGADDDTGFSGNPGETLIASLSLAGGTGELDLVTGQGSSILDWEFTYMVPGFWLDQYGNDLSLLDGPIMLTVDTNTDEVVFWPNGVTWSTHDGSAELVIPEPASMALLATGLFGMLGANIRRKRS